MSLRLRLEIGARDRAAGVVVFVNVGGVDVRVWQTANAWGDAALTFELVADGTKAFVRRAPQTYTVNLPVAVTLAAREELPVRFDLHDGTWEPADTLHALRPGAQLTAVYEAVDDDDARRQGVWIGSVRSNTVSVR